MIPGNKDGFAIAVVVNKAPGGFRLSTEAARLFCERKGIPLHFWPDDHIRSEGYNHYVGDNGETIDEVYGRSDADLIAVVRELGYERAGAPGATLRIVTLVCEIEIEDRDGFETARLSAWERAES